MKSCDTLCSVNCKRKQKTRVSPSTANHEKNIANDNRLNGCHQLQSCFDHQYDRVKQERQGGHFPSFCFTSVSFRFIVVVWDFLQKRTLHRLPSKSVLCIDREAQYAKVPSTGRLTRSPINNRNKQNKFQKLQNKNQGSASPADNA